MLKNDDFNGFVANSDDNYDSLDNNNNSETPEITNDKYEYLDTAKKTKSKSDNIISEMPYVVKQFVLYQRNVKGRSPKTANEYCFDLRTFFRFMKRFKGIVSSDTELENISIIDIDEDFIKSISNYDIYEFINFTVDTLKNKVSTRQRKTSALRNFFGYLTLHEGILDKDPTENLHAPKSKKSLPKYLTLEQSIELLNSVDGVNKERDYCILILLLNCGIRLSELVGIDFKSIIRSTKSLRVIGKGNKERMVYLNDACMTAIDEYIKVRPKDAVKDKNALFLSSRLTRISPKTVQYIVKMYLEKIGLGGAGYSVHKLRHTAATLMHQNGVDIRVLQDILGHENLGTTEIYTHVSNKQIENAAKMNPLSNVKSKKYFIL